MYSVHSQLIAPSVKARILTRMYSVDIILSTSVVDPFETSSSHIGQRTLCVLISDTPDVESHPNPTAQWGVLPQNGYAVQPSFYSVFRNVARLTEWYSVLTVYPVTPIDLASYWSDGVSR
jgi:hypothetical protein